jgi:erythromycin esterase
MDQMETTQQAVTEWLRQNALTLQAPMPGSGYGDLLPLKPLFEGVKIVGLGESTHGTREFFRCKHRMIEFLVKEMGFTVFALEASFAAGHAINRWLLHGTGNLTAALSGLKYIAWDTHEFLELLGWLREHNVSVPDGKKVRFYGLDYTYNDDGRKEVRGYLQDVDRGWATRIEPVFRVLAEMEAKWPIGIDDASRELARRVVPDLRELIALLNTTRDQPYDQSTLSRLSHIIRLCRVMLRAPHSITTPARGTWERNSSPLSPVRSATERSSTGVTTTTSA